ncbi:hypothetical protein Hte_003392 [Hypoxylon texense]
MSRLTELGVIVPKNGWMRSPPRLATIPRPAKPTALRSAGPISHCPEHLNTSLWLTNLPEYITYPDLLDHIAAFKVGRVRSTVINPVTPTSRTSLLCTTQRPETRCGPLDELDPEHDLYSKVP